MTVKQFLQRFWSCFSIGVTVGVLLVLAQDLIRPGVFDLRLILCVVCMSSVCSICAALLFWKKLSVPRLWISRGVMMVVTVCSSLLCMRLVYGISLAGRLHVLGKAVVVTAICGVPVYLLEDWRERRRIARINEELTRMQNDAE